MAWTTAWTTADVPDLTGRVAVVTGGNGGLGLETVKGLAGAGAEVVMAARDSGKAADAAAAVRSVRPGASVTWLVLDLASLASVRAAADRILADRGRLDILVNNAGVMAVSESRTEDGFEQQLGVNHLGHFALTALLLPVMLRAPAARIVTVTSTAHHTGRPLDPDNPHLHGSYTPWKAYGQSKLANFHFALGLHHRLAAAGGRAQSLLAHPGLTYSDLQTASVAGSGGGRSQQFAATVARRVGMTTADGARSQLRAATDPSAKGGDFFGPRWVNTGAPVRKPVLRRLGLEGAIARLWEVSERETGVTFDVAAMVAAAGA